MGSPVLDHRVDEVIHPLGGKRARRLRDIRRVHSWARRYESPGYVKFSMLLGAVEQETLHTLEATHELWQVQIARDALKNFAEAIDEKQAFLFPEVR